MKDRVLKFEKLFENNGFVIDDNFKNDVVENLIKRYDMSSLILLIVNNIIDIKKHNEILKNFWGFFNHISDDHISLYIDELYYFLNLLLENGGDVNAQDTDNYTLLMNAIHIDYSYANKTYKNINFKFTKLVLKYNPSLIKKNNIGNDVFDVFKSLDLKNIIKEEYPEKYEKYLREKEMKKFNI